MNWTVEKLLERLAVHPQLGIPVPGGTDPEVDDYTARTDSACQLPFAWVAEPVVG
ncbi:hypothetical protein ACFXKJ_27040 [Kitasatospora indigofera]|uniref:hypothetical protein n=1 Tax=Kitasatospora indigofera TaxID=67307 RepID=UPI0036863FD8